jgi:hypothetical protein
MMDDADMSDDRIQRRIDEGVARARNYIENHLPVTGLCHYCGDETRGRTFCSKDCADDYEHERQRKRELGK